MSEATAGRAPGLWAQRVRAAAPRVATRRVRVRLRQMDVARTAGEAPGALAGGHVRSLAAGGAVRSDRLRVAIGERWGMVRRMSALALAPERVMRAPRAMAATGVAGAGRLRGSTGANGARVASLGRLCAERGGAIERQSDPVRIARRAQERAERRARVEAVR